MYDRAPLSLGQDGMQCPCWRLMQNQHDGQSAHIRHAQIARRVTLPRFSDLRKSANQK